MQTPYKMTLLASLMLMLLATCKNGPDRALFCDVARPIYLNKADRLTPDTVREVDGHDKTGADECDWKP